MLTEQLPNNADLVESITVCKNQRMTNSDTPKFKKDLKNA
jgi:hypothetical protein